MRKKFVFVTLGLLASVSALFGQGTDALTFTRIDRNPATAAFAGAGSASTLNAAYSAFSNASVLPFYSGKMDAAVSWQGWAPAAARASHFNAGATFKVSPRIGVSLGYAMQRGTAFDILDEAGKPDGTFAPGSHLVALGAGFGLGERFGLGVNARYALQTLYPSKRIAGLSGDLFLAFQALEGLRFTVGASTLGPKVVSQSGSAYRQPASIQAAGEGVFHFGELHALNVLADVDYYLSGGFSAAAGLQYAWKEFLFLRGGYRLSNDKCAIPSHAGLGLGVQLAGFRLDVSWLTASSALGNTLSAGIGYRF